MPNGLPLKEMKARGRKVVIIAWAALTFETFLVLALGSLYGIAGLGASVFLLSITLLAVVWSLQDQIDAIDGAIHGTKDDSSYSDEVVEHLRRELERK